MFDPNKNLLLDWVKRKGKEQELANTANIMFPTKQSLFSFYRSFGRMINNPAQMNKFRALMIAARQEKKD